jgi:hypothetical protein
MHRNRYWCILLAKRSGNHRDNANEQSKKPADDGRLCKCFFRRSVAEVPKQHFAGESFCGMLVGMGSKDKGRKETKKTPKPKPKPEPGRKREILTPPPPK